MALRLRRGTDAERQSITPKQGELLYVTDTGLLYVGDGTTQGGNRVSGTIQDDASPTLSANLDLNGNDIVGNGNINIDGNITATGNINIGDGVEDNVIVGGTISSDLIPTTDTAFDLGSTNFRWQNAHLTGLFVDGNISAESITVNTIFKDDSGILYDGLTDSISAESVIANSFVGNLQGPVVGEDSSIFIDNVEKRGFFNEIDTSSINPSDNRNLLVFLDSPGRTTLTVAGFEDRGALSLVYNDPEEDLSGVTNTLGSIFFQTNGLGGLVTPSGIYGRRNEIEFIIDGTGDYVGNESSFVFTDQGRLGINQSSPQHILDVNGEIVTNSYIQFGSFTTTERDDLTPANGIVIYNTTEEKFQGYQNNAWINLDGTI